MKVYAKLRVLFSSNPLLLDLGELVKQLEKHYRVGYAGLFSTCLVLQTLSRSTRMSIGKITKVVRVFAADFEVLPILPGEKFSFSELQLVEERGRFRTRGGTRGGGTRGGGKTCRGIHINALGEEDISHITTEHMEALVGSEDEVVDFFNRHYSEEFKNSIIVAEWAEFRRYSRNKVRKWDKQQRLGGSLCRELGVVGELEPGELGGLRELVKKPVYDPDSDSEGNAERKQKLLRVKFLELAPELKKDDFLRDFELLIFENPHNSNVIASTKDGYFKYFDGKLWVKAFTQDFFDKVTTTRMSKATEILEKLQLSDFTRSMVTQILDFEQDVVKVVKDGILAAENYSLRATDVPNSTLD